ncbi:uncharacterized protein LOC111189336 [Astyanax mexicanus]|uniref:uncharacterized protein LOC111189336 n=1 Tax=Astyanax mexicanus TaxID=7994 RepID=UPI0020CB2D63|nr:uncharacterized protein LOC111189336 [Astyanax mexicanus]
MVNTCTIDNLLYILHLIMKKRVSILNEIELAQSKDHWLKTLLEVHRLFSAKEWFQGKLAWLKNFPRLKGKSVWDTFGTENDFIVSRLDYVQKTEWILKCDANDCPLLSLTKTDRTVDVWCEDLSELQHRLDDWSCPRSMSCQRKSKAKICKGTRTSSPRQFVNGTPAFIMVAIDSTVQSTNEPKMQPTALPLTLQILGQSYETAAVTYHLMDANHFVCFHRLSTESDWHFYDGIEEMKNPSCGDRLATPEVFKTVFSQRSSVGHIVLMKDITEDTNENTDTMTGPGEKSELEHLGNMENKIIHDMPKVHKWVKDHAKLFNSAVIAPQFLTMEKEEAESALEQLNSLSIETDPDKKEEMIYPFTFICNDAQDMKTLLSEIVDKRNLRVFCMSQSS